MHQQICQSTTLCPMNVKQFKSIESNAEIRLQQAKCRLQHAQYNSTYVGRYPSTYSYQHDKERGSLQHAKSNILHAKGRFSKKTLTNVAYLLLQIPVKKCKNVPHDACVKIPHQEHKTIKFNTYFFLLIVGYRFIKNFLCSAITLFRRSVTWGHLQIDATTILMDIDFLNI